MDVHLSCKDKQLPRDGWILTLRDDGCILTDPFGVPWARFPKDQAQNRIRLPSFAESVTDIQVYADNQRFIAFYQTKELADQIRSFYHQQLAASGPEAIQAERKKGWGMLVGGSVLAVLCIGLTLTGLIMTYLSKSGGSYYVLTGGMIMGIMLAAKGRATLKSAAEAERRLQSDITFRP